MPLIVDTCRFILATRDSGYKSLGHALAELIDNAFDAEASSVWITDEHSSDSILIVDNGKGMSYDEISNALSFGWSSQYDRRTTHGRFGMGLPNSSLSQAGRVDLYSWQDGEIAYHTYLDVEEVAQGKQTLLPHPQKIKLSEIPGHIDSKSGTSIVWSKLDKCVIPFINSTKTILLNTLGRVYRHYLWRGKNIYIGKEQVTPIDPLMLRSNPTIQAASVFGNKLVFRVKHQYTPKKKTDSAIYVTFSLLPVIEWHGLTNLEKRQMGITRGGGISIVRAGREIDYGWLLMGSKRKENYDDWWRCEIQYEPELDELFGLTNTKQGIRPSEFIMDLLTPEISNIARQLNTRVRKLHEELKSSKSMAEEIATKASHYISPIANNRKRSLNIHKTKITKKPMSSKALFETSVKKGSLILSINTNHPFYGKCFGGPRKGETQQEKTALTAIELALLAFGRTAMKFSRNTKNNTSRKWIEEMSDVLAAYSEHWRER